MSAIAVVPPFKEKLRNPRNGEFYFLVMHCPACALEFRLLWPEKFFGAAVQTPIGLKCPACQRRWSLPFVSIIWIGCGCDDWPAAPVESIGGQ